MHMSFSLGFLSVLLQKQKWLLLTNGTLSRVVVVVKLWQIRSCNLTAIATMKCFQKMIQEQQCLSKQW